MKNSDKQAQKKSATARKAGEPSPYAESLLEMSASTERLQAFTAAINTAGLSTLLEDRGPLTIFAPTDSAFEKIPSDQRAALLGDSGRLADLLRHHVVAGRVKAPRVKQPRNVKPEFGGELKLTASDKGFHVDEARIVKTNIRASNGVIHAIDTVLDPGATVQ
jgi:uncharacterized surface protein with fasciclin (FAS1) repeats